jgi:hypothetical protein
MRKREQIRLYDTDFEYSNPTNVFLSCDRQRKQDAALIPEKEIGINEELEASVSRLLSESDSQMEGKEPDFYICMQVA